jgi:L-ascorbate metabolism protein UlaG (beta-lactamase superfamily)
MANWLDIVSAAAVLQLLCGCYATLQEPPSSHFDGRRFFNPEGGDHTFGDTVKWFWDMETVDWPKWIDDPPQPPPVARVAEGALRVTYVNHATVLVQIDGINVLTDPMWSKRSGPISWIGVKRVRAPGLKFEQLPPIDVVLISHDHYDHLDLPTIERLAHRDHPRFLAGLGVGSRLRSAGVAASDIVELDWWQSQLPVGDLRFTFVPARHGSGRAPFAGNRTLWGGFIIDAPSGQVYFAGDTGFGAFVDDLAARYPRIRLAILPIGSYEKRWIMKTQHMSPDDAARAHRMLRAAQSVGIHYATFAEHPEQSIDAHEKDLAAALERRRIAAGEFWILGFGEGRDVPPLDEEPAPTGTRP